jgi:hypothetical protein
MNTSRIAVAGGYRVAPFGRGSNRDHMIAAIHGHRSTHRRREKLGEYLK